ncbi:MAG: hypothetical protein AAF656_01860, partial [Planctomycetota bacterium]
QVFTVTSNTVAAGTALSDITRNHKAVREVLARDFTGTDATANELIARVSGIIDTSEMPFLTIVSTRVAAFPNEVEFELDAGNVDAGVTGADAYDSAFAAREGFANTRAGSEDYDFVVRTVDADSDGTEDDFFGSAVADAYPAPLLDIRNHRTDTLIFFSRGDFRRQTGDADSDFSSNGQSNEAFIFYGHLRLFNGDWTNLNAVAAYGFPGYRFTSSGDENTNNQFSQQFTLGRSVILLVDPDIDSDGDGVNDAISGGSRYIWRTWNEPDDDTSKSGAVDRALPFDWSASSADVKFWSGTAEESARSIRDDDTFTLYDSRTDVAAVTIADFRKRLSFLINDFVGTTWDDDWWFGQKTLGAFLGSSAQPAEPFRFWGNPLLPEFNQAPAGELVFDVDSMAQRHNVLMPGASQFIVEFAGDFVTQDADGLITAALPDGTIDYYVEARDLSGNAGGSVETGASRSETENLRQVRWYGYPRDTNGDGIIARDLPEPDGSNSGEERSPDVLPVFDWQPFRGTSGTGAATSWPFEKAHPLVQPTVPTSFPGQPDPDESYGIPVSGEYDQIEVEFDGIYQCSWDPNLFGDYSTPAFSRNGINYRLRPSLIRIVVGAVDPQGRLEGTVFEEHVFQVRGPRNFEPVN